MRHQEVMGEKRDETERVCVCMQLLLMLAQSAIVYLLSQLVWIGWLQGGKNQDLIPFDVVKTMAIMYLAPL